MADAPGPLTALTPALAETVAGWVHSPAEVMLFAGPTLSYPLTADALLAAAAQQRRLVRLLLDDGHPVAFGSLQFLEDHARLGWVLTDPARRGQGWGRRIVTALLELARAQSPAPRINLGVYEHNVAARGLYADLGFVEVGERSSRQVESERWVNLTLERPL